jgi:pSer/pThr/pTyr-binding forkhead associated (FHA) protein
MVGTEYVFDEPCQPVIGRANDCTIQLPTNFRFAEVSRHHCLLDIDPPAIRVRDLGSLNGTFVNGEVIGQPRINRAPEEKRANASTTRELKGGDQLQVGTLVFRVGVDASEEPMPAVYLPPAFE